MTMHSQRYLRRIILLVVLLVIHLLCCRSYWLVISIIPICHAGISCPQLELKMYHYCDDIHLYLPIHILFDSRSAYLGSEVTEKLNKDFSKPWFGWKKDGTVANDLSDMTYKEDVLRVIRLMFVAHQQRWVDVSLRNLIGDYRLAEESRRKICRCQ